MTFTGRKEKTVIDYVRIRVAWERVERLEVKEEVD